MLAACQLEMLAHLQGAFLLGMLLASSCWNWSAPCVVHSASVLHLLTVVLHTVSCRPLWPEKLGWCWIPASACKYVWLMASCTPAKVSHIMCELNLHLG